MHDLARLLDAAAFAAERHRNQRRKDAEASPYINHPITLARLLAIDAGVDDVEILMAAVLHDTVEDTDTSLDELRERFGSRVASIVEEVTDDKSLPKAQRKALQVERAPFKSAGAALIKLADKTCNLRDITQAPPANWSVEKKREYFDWAKRVVDALSPVSDRLAALFREAYALRP